MELFYSFDEEEGYEIYSRYETCDNCEESEVVAEQIILDEDDYRSADYDDRK